MYIYIHTSRLCLSAFVRYFPREKRDPAPHVWFNPTVSCNLFVLPNACRHCRDYYCDGRVENKGEQKIFTKRWCHHGTTEAEDSATRSRLSPGVGRATD